MHARLHAVHMHALVFWIINLALVILNFLTGCTVQSMSDIVENDEATMMARCHHDRMIRQTISPKLGPNVTGCLRDMVFPFQTITFRWLLIPVMAGRRTSSTFILTV